MAESKKIKTNPEELTRLIEKQEIHRRKPASITDLARLVNWAHGGNYWSDTLVNIGVLNKVVLQMVFEGALVLRRGEEWAGLSFSTYGMNPRGRYYALPADVRVWEAKLADDAREAREALSKFRAKARLTELHPEEFKELVAEELAKLEAEAAQQ